MRRALVRDLGQNIHDQFTSKQPRTAESIIDVGATLHVETKAAGSERIDASETFAPVSFLLEMT